MPTKFIKINVNDLYNMRIYKSNELFIFIYLYSVVCLFYIELVLIMLYHICYIKCN
jgi:hypothetical protein